VAAAAVRWFTRRSPLFFRILASAATTTARVEAAATRDRGRRALYVAMIMSTLAGMAEADPSGALVAKKLGFHERDEQ